MNQHQLWSLYQRAARQRQYLVSLMTSDYDKQREQALDEIDTMCVDLCDAWLTATKQEGFPQPPSRTTNEPLSAILTVGVDND